MPTEGEDACMYVCSMSAPACVTYISHCVFLHERAVDPFLHPTELAACVVLLQSRSSLCSADPLLQVLQVA